MIEKKETTHHIFQILTLQRVTLPCEVKIEKNAGLENFVCLFFLAPFKNSYAVSFTEIMCCNSLNQWLSNFLAITLSEYDFPGGSSKASAYNAGDLGSIPGWGRSSGEGRRSWKTIVQGVAKSQTRLSNFTFTFFLNEFFFFLILQSVRLLFSCQVASDSLQPCELQHARLPCPSLSLGVCSSSCPLSW